MGICLGKGLAKALGDKAGIHRYGWASVPMEEALARVALDISGRAGVVFNVKFSGDKIGTFDVQLVEEFLRDLPRGRHQPAHQRPLRRQRPPCRRGHLQGPRPGPAAAKAVDPTRKGDVPSTKGSL